MGKWSKRKNFDYGDCEKCDEKAVIPAVISTMPFPRLKLCNECNYEYIKTVERPWTSGDSWAASFYEKNIKNLMRTRHRDESRLQSKQRQEHKNHCGSRCSGTLFVCGYPRDDGKCTFKYLQPRNEKLVAYKKEKGKGWDASDFVLRHANYKRG